MSVIEKGGDCEEDYFRLPRPVFSQISADIPSDA